MVLKFTVNHAVAYKRDIRANIFESAALEERERSGLKSMDITVRTK